VCQGRQQQLTPQKELEVVDSNPTTTMMK